MIALTPQISGYEILALCQNIAVKNGVDYFGLKNGTLCMFGLSDDDNFSSNGASKDCNSICGTDKTSKGMQCGGASSISIFKLGVITH